MKYSDSLIHTKKSSKDFDSVNATYLIRGGFINQTMSGVYTFLPLGLRVLNKIEDIVREEMDKIGEEMLMPALAPKKFWKTTGRYDTIDVLMKTSPANEVSKEKNSSEYVLNCTHEDVITPIVKKYGLSYNNLPAALYQIQSKFRNEPRAKSGLLRCREFRMKDLYSFHITEEDFQAYYEKSKEAYMKVYNRLGIGDITYVTRASGGDFTDQFSHEFQTKCETGEDTVFHVDSEGVTFNQEIAPSEVEPPEGMEDEEIKEREDVYGENIVGMDDLVEFLDVAAERCVKTLIYQADGRPVVAAVRGDYDVNELKLKKVIGCKELELADQAIVLELTGAIRGYAGIVDLPEDTEVYFDDSIEPLKNFECGTNKTNYHSINVNWDRDVERPDKFYDIKMAKEGDLYPETGERYEVFAASEVGNIFPLGIKFTSAFEYTAVDHNGEEKEVYMGSYGIGTSRLMGILVEIFNDKNGIIWPKNVAPYHVYLVTLGDNPKHMQEAEEIYSMLWGDSIEVLWDDREDSSAGEKFADADLIGCPIRLVLSKRSLDKGGVELKKRDSDESEIVSTGELADRIKELLA